MKVVINRCFGGFGISNDALLELIKRNAKCVYIEPDSPGPLDRVEFKGGFAAERSLPILYKDNKVYSLDWHKTIRTDPDLIAVVETLGTAANGDYAQLEVVEVPDGVSWFIESYDGRERISESHRTWG